MYKVDLNSDLGESFGAYTIGLDSQVVQYVSSVNVACGYHAGDPLVMDKTVAAAKAAGVAVGAMSDSFGWSWVYAAWGIVSLLGAALAFMSVRGKKNIAA